MPDPSSSRSLWLPDDPPILRRREFLEIVCRGIPSQVRDLPQERQLTERIEGWSIPETHDLPIDRFSNKRWPTNNPHIWTQNHAGAKGFLIGNPHRKTKSQREALKKDNVSFSDEMSAAEGQAIDLRVIVKQSQPGLHHVSGSLKDPSVRETW
jgi:hypothetical protein